MSDHLHDLLTRQGAAPALHADGRTFSWDEVSGLGQRIVEAVNRAVRPEEAVAFVIRNRPAHVAALFALLAHGHPIRFVNGFQTAEKIAADIAGLSARTVVADETDWAEPALSAHSGPAIVLHPWGVTARPAAADAPPAGPCLPGTAVEVFTSGTTGTPKRICMTRETLYAAIVDQALIAAEMGEAPASAGPPATLIQYAPIVHVAGLWTVLQAGVDGRALVMMEKFDAARWIDAIRTLRPTLAGMSPPLLRMVLDAAPAPEDLSSLVAIRFGSTALDADTRAEFDRRYGIPLLGVYGATEYAGVVASWSLEDFRRYGVSKAAAAGRIRAHVAQARIVDANDGHVLPIGQRGLLELLVPRMSDDWIRSTDLSSLDEDGFLMLHGRADSAIVRGGFKILPDQLVAVLRRHPAVADAAVVGLPDRRLGQIPAAAVELRPGAAVNAAELEAHMRAALPAYQVPAAYRVVAALPRTPSNKVIPGAVGALFEEGGAGVRKPQ